MEKELTMLKKGERKLREWKKQAEELNLQLHLGIAETKEEFEKQKKKLRTWLDSLSEQLDHSKEVSKEKLLDIKSSLEALRVQAALGKAESEEYLKEQQKNLTNGLYELKQKMSGKYKSTRDAATTMIEEASDQVDGFHTRFDLFRLQFHLGKAEAQEEWNEKKKELSHKLAMVRAKLNRAEREISVKEAGFSSEMREAWRHFKKAFRE